MCRARHKGIPVYAIGGCAELDGVSGISRFSSDGGYDCYFGRGFGCIVPAVSGEYDSELAMRKDIAERNVAAAAAFLAKEILGNPQ